MLRVLHVFQLLRCVVPGQRVWSGWVSEMLHVFCRSFSKERHSAQRCGSGERVGVVWMCVEVVGAHLAASVCVYLVLEAESTATDLDTFEISGMYVGGPNSIMHIVIEYTYIVAGGTPQISNALTL